MMPAAESTATLNQLTESVSALPPLPSTAQEILTCFGDEFIDAEKIALVVEGDPGICARLLGLSNSAYFGLPEPVTTMSEAISMVLGVDTVRSLVLAMAIQRSFSAKRCPAFNIERFWRQSILTAECCKRIAIGDDLASEIDLDLAYSTGLCHNIGLMALAHMEPRATHGVLTAHNESRLPGGLSEALTSQFDYDHRTVTATLAAVWSLPESMIRAFRFRSMQQGSADKDHRLSLILAAAAAAVDNSLQDDVELQRDLSGVAGKLGMTEDGLVESATFTDKHKERIHSLSGNMSG